MGWFDVYSVLEQGNYRFTTTLIEELGPMSVEFTVGPMFSTENVHLSVGDVTPTSMRVYMTVDRDVYTLGDVWVHWEGPYTIEKKTEDSWEPLPLRAETWKQTTTQTAVWDEFDWPVDWSACYGILESGTYRFTTELAEDIGPMSVEFEIPEMDSLAAMDRVHFFAEPTSERTEYNLYSETEHFHIWVRLIYRQRDYNLRVHYYIK